MRLRNNLSSFYYNVSLRGWGVGGAGGTPNAQEMGCQEEAQQLLGLIRNYPPSRDPSSQCLRSCRTSAVSDSSTVSPPASLRTSSREGDARRKAFAWRSLRALPAGPLCSSKCRSGKQKHVQPSDFLEVKPT